jgi:hypothetical protein
MPEQNALSLNSGSPCDNGPQWKDLLPQSVKDGVLFKDSELEISLQIQTMKYLVRSLITFKGAGGQHSNNIKVTISNQSELAKSMEIQASPVKYTQGEAPQVIVMAMIQEAALICPCLSITIELLLSTKTINIRLPVYVNKVIECVD